MDATQNVINRTNSKNFSGNSGDVELLIQTVPNKYYDDGAKEFDFESIDFCSLAEEKIFVNGKEAIEGELMISKIDSLDCKIDEVGFLILDGKNKDNFEINEQGELIYNY